VGLSLPTIDARASTTGTVQRIKVIVCQRLPLSVARWSKPIQFRA
jgi:hypothetical protein